ncbi:Regulatory protein BlaR1 [Luteitalea pratensis]|uniref:Regulatory protein BlaR1 n=1 Tax=Luteitalea pratensis TaxID=1855912 RepID=A0A143PMB8_LUTPR|nr:M56 family metallopeptidase [Luteitalea pratensis]AMY08914.1 Regulatory protein BlaR1 [Luteitalea pratensis]
MTATTADPLVLALAGLLVKATLVIGLAVAVRLATARWLSASGRHLVMALAVVMLLALPVLALLLPAWAPPAPAVPSTATVATTGTEPLDDSTPTSWSAMSAGTVTKADVDHAAARVEETPLTRVPWGVVLLLVQVSGTFLMLVHLGLQRWRVHQLGRAATVVTDPAWLALLDDGARAIGVHRTVRLLRSRRGTMPMTFGTMRPAILLPATADTWDDERRRAVLVHELAHVARLDCLAQWAACAMRAVYWMHPAAWWLVSRLRLDREFACDDLVLAAGAPPVEYARHLLDIAYTFGGGRAPALAVRMARRSQLEGRLRALLDDTRTRREPSRPARVATTIGAFAVLLPLASVTAPVPRTIDERTGDEIVSSDVSGEASPSHVVTAQERAVQRTWTASSTATATVTRQHASPIAMASAQAAAPATAAAQAAGTSETGCTWEVGRGTGDLMQLSMRHGRSQNGRSVPITALEGLTSAQLASGGPIRFVLRRDAGSFGFEGTARDGVAAGVCSFTPSPTFGAELAKRGISGLTPDDQVQLARHDIGLAFVDELRTQKYATPSVADLVKAGQHGVHVEYLRGMGALGYSTGTLEPLVKLRDHGVTPDYAKALAWFGYSSLPIEQLQRARDHGVTPDYLQGLRDGGFGSLTLDQAINARDHGITPTYVKEMKALGISGSVADLVNARDHGITPDFVQGMRDSGFSGLSLEELINTRDHGVTPDYVRKLVDLGYKNLTLEQLRRLKDHGVSPDYVSQVQAAGYKSLTVDDLVTLRDHAVTAERIRQANARAGSPLTVAQLRDAASNGWR